MSRVSVIQPKACEAQNKPDSFGIKKKKTKQKTKQ